MKEDLKNLCKYLWGNPNVILFLINNSYNKDLVDNLIQLISNRFYNNLYSPNVIEPQLFYIISFFLKKEINELTFEKKFDFLKKTLCYKIFKRLRRNPKFIKYFRPIIKDIINDVYIYSQKNNNELYEIILSNEIYLSIPTIEEKINEKRNEEKKIKEKGKNTKHNIYNNKNNKKLNINHKNIINIDEITKKYFINITKNYLKEKIKEYNNNILLKDFCEFQLKSFDIFAKDASKNELFSNNNLFKRISSSSIKEVEEIYKRNFALTIHLMNNFLSIINEKIKDIPFEIRQICKLIKLLIIEKFPSIKKFESNAMICIFFFENILFPFFINPQLNSLLMVSKNISEGLYYNLLAITRYLKCFFNGYFYFEYNDECDFTPFNAYFIEKLPLLDEIIEKICDVEIPEFINKLIIENKNINIEDEINFNYLYNEKYIIYHQSFCISFGELSFIMKNIYVNHDKLFENGKNLNLNKTWDKIFKHKLYKDLISGKALKENPISNNKIEKNKKNNKIPIEKDTHQIYQFFNNINSKPKLIKEYFLINNIEFNTNEKDYHEIKLLNNNFLNYDINNKEIFPILQKSFCDILNSIPSFEELLFTKKINRINIKDFNTLIIEIKKYLDYYYFNHMNFDQTAKSIELKWALNFFIENEEKILKELKENNYLLFFYQLENDLNNSINSINKNFSIISHFYDTNINFNKNQQNCSYILLKLKKMSLNLIVQKIIQNFSAYIQVSVKIVKNKNKNPKNIWSELVFEIKKGKTKDDKWYDINNVYISEKNNYINFKTIESFIDNFSFENEFFNTEKNNENSEEKNNIFDYLYQLKIPEKINTYIDTSIKEMLLEKNIYEIYSKQDIPNIVSKIKKNIFYGLYDKIYRNYIPSFYDDLIYKKSIMLSWTTLLHFTNGNFPLHQSLIPSIIECFIKFEKKKIPKAKLFYLNKINEILSTIHCQKEISFNNKKLNNTLYLNPILIYSLIKSKLHNFASDIRFLEVFMVEKDKENRYIEEMKKYILFIIDMTHKDLYGNITEEDYNKNCNIFIGK